MHCLFHAFQLPFILSYEKIDPLIFTLIVVNKDNIMLERIVGDFASAYQSCGKPFRKGPLQKVKECRGVRVKYGVGINAKVDVDGSPFDAM